MLEYSNYSYRYGSYTILQIIPCTQKLMAKYYIGEFGDEDIDLAPIICFALIECEDKSRYIVPMDITADGEIDISMDSSSFMSIEGCTINPNPGGDK